MTKSNTDRLLNEPVGWVLVALSAMLWGSDVLLRPKALGAGVSPVSIVMFEHIALAAIFVPVLYRTRDSWLHMNRKQFLGLLLISWGGSGLATVLLTQAYATGNPVTAAILQKLQPIFAVSLAGPFLREKLKGIYFLYFAIALGGAYLMSFGFTWVNDPMSQSAVTPALCAVGAAAIWGACTVIGRWSLAKIQPFTVAGLRFALAVPFMLAWNLLLPGPVGAKFSISSVAFLPILAIVLIPDALGMVLYYVGLRRTTASLATLAELAYPATAIVLAYPLAKTFTPWKWVGVLLLIGSLYLIRMGHAIKSPVSESAAA